MDHLRLVRLYLVAAGILVVVFGKGEVEPLVEPLT